MYVFTYILLGRQIDHIYGEVLMEIKEIISLMDGSTRII